MIVKPVEICAEMYTIEIYHVDYEDCIVKGRVSQYALTSEYY